ncbi:hypothetical protein I305_04827 [Cryptococcus gattii E566]|uniref:Uncharacterized protein n=2 Tax=Cryptococcus gattii TaxID=37769 RepID=E6RG16_CRYGW|nr:Hypothetical Protein CGB_N1560W [Cryptococcus gattii WM276]ADV25703.1 Hypothetical Protein CGB_N1560W [Cryptococcus gattii WM276]KIY32669.1 hypothetical protein I305_04827 [Cryptococcus gattii E566]KJE00531.1 hypothetical protein I311_05870 [Cryptococcus gattii NT-10]
MYALWRGWQRSFWPDTLRNCCCDCRLRGSEMGEEVETKERGRTWSPEQGSGEGTSGGHRNRDENGMRRKTVYITDSGRQGVGRKGKRNVTPLDLWNGENGKYQAKATSPFPFPCQARQRMTALEFSSHLYLRLRSMVLHVRQLGQLECRMGRLGVDKQLRADGVRRLAMALGVKKEGDEPDDHL